MKFTIKEVFNLNEEEIKNEEVVKKSTEKVVDNKLKRMQQLMESFNIKGEIKKEIFKKESDKDNLKEVAERNKKLSTHRLNETVRESGMNYGGGYDQTVNTFMSPGSFVKKNATVGSFDLTDSEALEVSIRRTLKSGAPINNISFFDEVNYNLNQLGFEPKQPLDIKNAISALMQFGTLKNDTLE